jgi:hypothetical protein
MEPPRPPFVPAAFPNIFGHHQIDGKPLRNGVPVPAVSARDIIIGAQGHNGADGHGLLPDRKMRRPVQHSAGKKKRQLLFEFSDGHHLFIHLKLLRNRNGAWQGSVPPKI